MAARESVHTSAQGSILTRGRRRVMVAKLAFWAMIKIRGSRMSARRVAFLLTSGSRTTVVGVIRRKSFCWYSNRA